MSATLPAGKGLKDMITDRNKYTHLCIKSATKQYVGITHSCIEHAVLYVKAKAFFPDLTVDYTRNKETFLDRIRSRKVSSENKWQPDKEYAKAARARYTQCKHARNILEATQDAQLWLLRSRGGDLRLSWLEATRCYVRNASIKNCINEPKKEQKRNRTHGLVEKYHDIVKLKDSMQQQTGTKGNLKYIRTKDHNMLTPQSRYNNYNYNYNALNNALNAKMAAMSVNEVFKDMKNSRSTWNTLLQSTKSEYNPEEARLIYTWTLDHVHNMLQSYLIHETPELRQDIINEVIQNVIQMQRQDSHTASIDRLLEVKGLRVLERLRTVQAGQRGLEHLKASVEGDRLAVARFVMDS